jgi:hypothetical protein
MSTTRYKEFWLDEKQNQKLVEWQEKIKDLFGEYGSYTFSFGPNGIGVEVKVFSHLTETSLDLTDMDSW